MEDMLKSFMDFSLTVQQNIHQSIAPAALDAQGRGGWRALVEQERRALEALPQNEEGIPTHIIPAALPQDPNAFVEPNIPPEDDYSLRAMREMQDEAYAQSLLEDRQRMQEREAEEELEAMKEAMEMSLQEEKERQRLALEAAVKPEPAEGEEGVCVLAVRLPDGSRLQRRLLRQDTIGNLRDWLRTQTDVVPERFIIAMDYPRREFRDESQTLEDAGMFPRAAINVLAVEDDEDDEEEGGGDLVNSNSNNNSNGSDAYF